MSLTQLRSLTQRITLTHIIIHSLITIRLEYYEILNSRFALEHRYVKNDPIADAVAVRLKMCLCTRVEETMKTPWNVKEEFVQYVLKSRYEYSTRI